MGRVVQCPEGGAPAVGTIERSSNMGGNPQKKKKAEHAIC